MTETANKGLEGIVALTSSVSSIVDGVLTYGGYNIDDLTDNTTFEEVVYLLIHGDLPTQGQLDILKKQLDEERALPEEALKAFKNFPKKALPMEKLRTAVSLLGMYDAEANENTPEANYRKAVRMIAQFPTIIAAQERLRHGKAPVAPKTGMTTAESFLYMMHDKMPDQVAVDALDKALILHADHELNASTFAARQTASTLSDIYSAMTSAIGTLKGPLHGGANEQVMRTLLEIGSVENVGPYLDSALERKERIMGFGHRVYKDGDPRANHLKAMSKALGELSGETKWYEMSIKLNDLMVAKKGLKPNVDFYSASAYYALGIPLDLFTPIFAMSRVSGWCAHVLEQLANNRLIRPRADYTGETHRTVKPIAQR